MCSLLLERCKLQEELAIIGLAISMKSSHFFTVRIAARVCMLFGH